MRTRHCSCDERAKARQSTSPVQFPVRPPFALPAVASTPCSKARWGSAQLPHHMSGRAKNVVAALVQAFEVDQLPLTGVKGLTDILRKTQATFDTGYHLQSLSINGDGPRIAAALAKQHEFLLSSGALDEEDSARTALSGWHLILEKYKTQPMSSRLAAMAIEDGALHTHSLATQHSTTWWLEDDNTGDPGTQAAECSGRLDDIAQQVTLSQPDSLPRALLEDGRDAGRDLRIATRQELAAAAAALGRGLRFDAPPFEWVYEGYRPLLLPDVVGLRRGAPLALAVVTLCVLRRLGLTAVPYFPQHEEVDLSALMGMAQLATAPALPRVLLCGGTPDEPCVLDASMPKGAWVLPDTQLPAGVQLRVTAQDVFRVWAEHAATMVTACQRRGESDEVVRWLYQHAALHPDGCKLPGWDDGGAAA
eukprot:jgi/Ulvmu1/7682/UM038_0113.1